AANWRHRAGSSGPRPWLSPGRLARPSSVASGITRSAGRDAELIHAGLAIEDAGVFVLLGAGADLGMRGQGLVGGHVAPRQAGRSGILAEQLHAARVLLGGLPAAGGRIRVDGERRLHGELLDLAVGLAGQVG